MTMLDLARKLKRLRVFVGSEVGGELLKESGYSFAYARDGAEQPWVSLLMPAAQALYQDGDLFPAMDMNLPEGFLFQRLIDMYPKQPLSKMHLLQLMGANGIGRIGYAAGDALRPAIDIVSRESLLARPADDGLFGELVEAYLATGAGISGVQPKIMVPTRLTTPIPDLIVKTSGPAYPLLAANEFLCLSAARHAGLPVPGFDLSVGGDILVVDRFDLQDDGGRLGFEDIAALMALRVNDRLSDRKYQRSYEAVADVIRIFSGAPGLDLAAFFDQLALSVMVRNGDAHLKNFGMLYSSAEDIRLSPLFDVVTTTMYRYERAGVESVDRTLALKWRRGRHHATKAYPTLDELLAFGREICDVNDPGAAVVRIAQGMERALDEARRDARIPAEFLARLGEQWLDGLAYAAEVRARRRTVGVRTA